MLYNISVHLFMPAGIASPGFEEEEKTKHKVTLKIEESDTQISPDECAKHLIDGTSCVGFRFCFCFCCSLLNLGTRMGEHRRGERADE